jgi:hypothetical protein
MGEHLSINCAVVEDCGTHYVLSITSDSPSVKLALSGDDAPEWLDSMHDELHSMMSNDVYDLGEPPKNCNIVGSKWVSSTSVTHAEKFNAENRDLSLRVSHKNLE